MYAVNLDSETDFDGWRDAARRLASHGIADHSVDFLTPGQSPGLLTGGAVLPTEDGRLQPRVPRGFLAPAERVVAHRDPERFARLYRILLRLQDAPGLLGNAADPDIAWLNARDKSVRRDLHKMHAFVRFRKTGEAKGREQFAAWFEPDHRILHLAAPFFRARFPNMDWAILSPEASVRWDGVRLEFGQGARREDLPGDDALEDHWRAYFRAIFNPARLKVSAMTSEMPKKYWHNLPEAALIPELIAGARSAAAQMGDTALTAPAVRAARIARHRPEPDSGMPGSLAEARKSIETCRQCALCETASQPVFGEGPDRARLMVVGEQPGDAEDLSGRPFVGPAGQVLDRILDEAGLDRRAIFLTNAVKHFKFNRSGKKRLHARPNAGEIDTCRWWLDLERREVKPAVIVALGATACRAVLGPDVPFAAARGHFMESRGARVMTSWHPAYLLRVPDATAANRARQDMIAHFTAARAALSSGSGQGKTGPVAGMG